MSDAGLNRDGCHLWQFRKDGNCVHGSDLRKKVKFEDGNKSLEVKNSQCMTWNAETQSAEVSYCLFIRCRKYRHTTGSYKLPTNISGSELNNRTCMGYYFREGLRCQKCLDGYGPAVFYDGVTCANCSEHRYMWILNLLFQLTCVAFTYITVILLQFKGTSCPLNITITYSQLSVNILMISSRLQNKLVCRFGEKFAIFIFTVFGVFNLDFFRYVIPPLCVTTSASPVDVLLFDYVIAISPFVFTVLCYWCVLIHDKNCNNRLIAILSFPMKKCFKRYTNWNPKETILNTFATFLLCGYTKLLFVSVNLLVGIHSYNSHGEMITNSTVLLYDPTIKFFDSVHTPYIVVAVSVIIVFVLSPPLLLLFYPTRCFRKCLEYCGFQEWGVLHMIMDIFQGWYKDGTDSTFDYRPFSALYMLIRITVGCTFIIILFTDYDGVRVDIMFGILHVFFGIFFSTTKPYKKNWMNKADGFLLTFTGVMLLLTDYHSRVYIIVTIIGTTVISTAYLYAFYKCLKLFC